MANNTIARDTDGAWDPNIRVLKITPDNAEFWDSPGSVISYVKMRPDLGDTRKAAI
jgi:hypothetical protein